MTEYPVTQDNIEYRSLDPNTSQLFLELLPQNKWVWFNRIIDPTQELPDRRTIGIGAFEGKVPIGVVLAEIKPGTMVAEVEYVWVKEDYQQKGIGTALLGKIESALQARNCNAMLIHYRPGHDNAPALVQMLQKLDWAEPQLLIRTYKTDKRMTTSSWLDFEIPLSDEVAIFKWADLTAQERQALEEKLAGSEVNPLYVSPFFAQEQIEPMNSLGLRYRGEVVGWLITHRITPDTIRYNSIYIQENLRGLSGAAMAMLIQAVKLHRDWKPEIPYAVFAVRGTNTAMLQIIDKYLAPQIISKAEQWHSWKPKGLNFL